MKTRWIPILAVALVAITIVAYKQLRQAPREKGGADGIGASAASSSVLLFADPREANGDDPCAEIFRLVRQAGARGIRVREVAPSDATEATRKYRVTVAPTVLIVDSSGHIVSRYEGESSDTIQAVRASLENLTKSR